MSALLPVTRSQKIQITKKINRAQKALGEGGWTSIYRSHVLLNIYDLQDARRGVAPLPNCIK